MQDIKYYVLWTKDSPLLKEYLEKYYNKLTLDLNKIKESWVLKQEIEKLLKVENLDFILNADISSLINSILLNTNNKSIIKLKKEINIFLSEWIESKNLIQNKGEKIAWTNIKLTVEDNNPYNKQETHPEHIKGWAIAGNWWEASEEDWLKIYENSFNLLKELDEWIFDELNQIITKIIPLWTARWIHNSASYKECVGHLYMWFTIDSDKPEINNLEAIIHESSHNKLNLIMQFDPIVLNSKEEKYYSAIRPDARHIHWVFLGYHAFAPTMYIIMKAYVNWFLWKDINWLEKIVLYHIKTKFLQKVIKKYAKLTDLWKEISEEIDYIISMMDILLKQINPDKEIFNRAKQRQIEHFSEVNMNYPYLEY
jgi:hypothetical protein